MSFSASLEDVCAATGATWVQGEPDAAVHGVGTDTRALREGELFIALEGPNFDGNRFAAEAAASGATALLLKEGAKREFGEFDVAVLTHPDPLAGLGALAAWHRSRLSADVIGITGSSGKTTCKTIAEHLFGRVRRTVASPKSFNNAIGVPLSILAAAEDTEVLVLEMGTSAPGEIAALCRIASPTAGLVTLIGPAHLEFLGSLEGVAEEKGALPASLPDDGLFVVSADEPFVDVLRGRSTARTITFGIDRAADLTATDLLFHEHGTSFRLAVEGRGVFDVTSPLLGGHNVRNLLSVLALAHGLGHELGDVLAGVPDLAPARQRLERHELEGVLLIDDTYNANPDSARAAVRVLAGFHGHRRRVLVLGDMLELGDLAAEHHFQVGADAARSGLEQVVAVGELARAAAAGALEGGLPPQRVEHFADTDAAIVGLRGIVQAGDVVLVKGSRGMRLERAVAALVETFGRKREA